MQKGNYRNVLLLTCPLLLPWEIVRSERRFLTGIYTGKIWYLEFIRNFLEHLAQFVKITIRVILCRLQCKIPVDFFIFHFQPDEKEVRF